MDFGSFYWLYNVVCDDMRPSVVFVPSNRPTRPAREHPSESAFARTLGWERTGFDTDRTTNVLTVYVALMEPSLHLALLGYTG